ncbi:MAG: glycosyltransferase family 4 protein [Thaumarchaeota archaeon]|nr:glycosyltransferase family 4 protein [Nitrososphaerota archaeon]
MSKLGHQVSVITNDILPSVELKRLNQEYGIQVYSIPFSRSTLKSMLFGDLEFSLRASKFFQKSQIKPDVIHASQASAFFFAYLKGIKEIREPLVTKLHGLFETYYLSTLRQVLDCRLYEGTFRSDYIGVLLSPLNWARYLLMLHQILQHSDRIIVINQFMKTKLVRTYRALADKIKVVYNGIDPYELDAVDADCYEYLRRIKNHNKLVLHLGAYGSEKGTKYLMHAFRRLSSIHRDVKLVIAGYGSDGELLHLIKMSKNLGIRKNLFFFRNVPRRFLSAFYRNADIFVNASPMDSLGNVTLEAMYCARPVICSRSGGAPEVIIDNKNGMMFRPFDVKDLSNKMSTLIEDEKFGERIGIEARNTILERNLTWERTSKETVSILKEIA